MSSEGDAVRSPQRALPSEERTGHAMYGPWMLAGYAGSIVGANWLIATYGLVPVGFGLMAPAGVYAAGLAFTFRDLVRERYGYWPTVAAIFVGAALSALLSPAFAAASGMAFLFSESLDALVFEKLRRRRWLTAVAASNVAGFVADSALFLLLAFGSLDFLAGQLLGKAYMTVLAVAVLWAWRRQGAVSAACLDCNRNVRPTADNRCPRCGGDDFAVTGEAWA